MTAVGTALGLLALAIIGYGVWFGWALLRMRGRRRHHTGSYAVAGLDERFTSLDEARATATDAVRHDQVPAPAQLLAERDDGGWDVVDEIHVLG